MFARPILDKAVLDKAVQKTELLPPDLHYIKLKGGYTGDFLLKRYACKITDAIKKTITGDVSDDPVARQYIPQSRELEILPEERIDPTADNLHTPVKGIVRRHPDRALLKPTSICAANCRYCFRREMVGPGSDVLSTAQLATALDYIRTHPEIWEVILSGGDPLILSTRRLENIIDQLMDVQHLQVLRIHTRVPVVAPERITDELCRTICREKPVYVALHVNHTNEITPDVEAALAKLRKAGCILLSQSVLLKGVNDDANTLETFLRKLVTLGVKPYYIHHPDLAPGTGHFRLSIKEGQAIMRELLGRVSGICQPQYMLDIPGGHGKVPISSGYLEELGGGSYIVEDGNGDKHIYPPLSRSAA